ncbi:hypothetical protein P40081_28505 [Paenibacillus sp. FSL P4-0081]|uniref:hypothetical protein n=1 Tax=Paenibacillus sp. FSL P4-0081 TaxID=1536769 RepID=UPI0004F782D9|nr:hypothetical protein [Paenibacillus sp. FSL P4-0081]AIQ31637.1 hypothetical protein P40081_28505 [Paenibacillus sp. FSL P4-0081]
MANFKLKEVTTKSGSKYTLQFPGVRAVTKITDRIKNKHGIPSDERLAEEMLAHVVVEPKLKLDDFESFAELTEIIGKSYAFITGQDDADELEDDAEDQ